MFSRPHRAVGSARYKLPDPYCFAAAISSYPFKSVRQTRAIRIQRNARPKRIGSSICDTADVSNVDKLGLHFLSTQTDRDSSRALRRNEPRVLRKLPVQNLGKTA